MNLISANQSQQDFSTQQRIFQPSQTWFHSFIFHVNCFAFQRQSGQWSMPGQSRQPDATTWIDKPDLGADSTHRPKKNHVFSEPSSIRFRPRYCQLLLHDPLLAPVPFPTKLWVRCWQGRWLPGFYFTKRRQSSQLRAGNLLTSQFVADTAKNRYFFQLIGVRGSNSFFLATSVISKIHRRPKRVLVYLVGSLFVTIGGFFKGKLWNDHSCSSILMYLNTQPNFDIFLLNRFYRRKRWK